ncbi:MAG: hypothetical protein ABH863_05455 [Candidatus Micrarchaeota archaeon]
MGSTFSPLYLAVIREPIREEGDYSDVHYVFQISENKSAFIDHYLKENVFLVAIKSIPERIAADLRNYAYAYRKEPMNLGRIGYRINKNSHHRALRPKECNTPLQR